MKTTMKILLLPAAVALGVFLSGCGGEEENQHDGHDHKAMKDASAAGEDGYPLSTCVVSGEPLGSMGTPVEVVHDGVTVKLCCKSCIKKFNATPEAFVAKLNDGN